MDLTPYNKEELRLFNTMTRSKEIFSPQDEDQPVRMYNCGPTVYDYQHIGNLRAYIFVDILRRTLEANGYSVTQVINITDVGHLVSDGDTGADKMTKGLEAADLPITLSAMQELGEKYAKLFKADLKELNVTEPEYFPKASEHIDEDIALIEILETKGFTYEIDDGVYFNTDQLSDYGKLAGGLSDDTRERVDNKEKRNPRDFALWKFDNRLGWKSPWGQGFPGWHIECSVMSMQYLGESFDIHTGGIDHIPVHHSNEIAQSEAATGQPMANFWLHNDFITIEDEKISKSIGNTLYLKTLKKHGYAPLAYRYLLLSARYRTKMNFSFEALDGAGSALARLYTFMRRANSAQGDVLADYVSDFMAALNNDLNTPVALAVMWELFDDDNSDDNDKAATIALFDQVLGLDLASPPIIDIPESVKKLVDRREKARENQDFEAADELRQEIAEAGFSVQDTDDGAEIIPSSG